MNTKQYYVYILTNKKYGILYTGVTSDLIKRIHQHKAGTMDGFTKKYQIKKLVYYEIHTEIEHAIIREKRIKRWYRDWKINLIESQNPTWSDLTDRLF